MAFAFGRATPSLRQAPLMCLDNPVLGNIIFSLNGEHHLLLKVLHFRVDKRKEKTKEELKKTNPLYINLTLEKDRKSLAPEAQKRSLKRSSCLGVME